MDNIEVIEIPLPLRIEETQEYTKVWCSFIPGVEAVEATKELAIQSFKRTLSFHFLIHL